MTSCEHHAGSETAPARALDRRHFLFGSAAAGVALVLAACGSDDDGASGTTAPAGTAATPTTNATGPTTSQAPQTTSAVAASGGFPVEIEGTLGTITIEQAPERVVAVGSYRDLDAAVALGVVPLATADGSNFFEQGIAPWVLRELAGVATPELLAAELPFETIAALHPDLILGTDRPTLDQEYEQLSAIAPTLSPANGYNKDPWQLTTTRVGAALGASDLVDALIAGVEALVTGARDSNPAFAGKTFTFGPVQADGTINTINSTTDASVVFLSDLGLQLSHHVLDLPQASFPGRSVIGPERLDLLDADVILLTFTAPAARDALEANPLFQALPAVQRGAYIALDLPTALALAFPSALSIPYGLEAVVPKLAAVFA